MAAIAIIQARMGSTRLPGKVLMQIMGRPMLCHIVNRVRLAEGVDSVIVATSALAADEPVRQLCRDEDICCYAGDEADVLDRFYQAAKAHDADPVIRITGDCPLADPEIISRLITMYRTGVYDHVGVATGAGALYLEQGRYPDGLDAECFSFAALERAWQEADWQSDREHVTPYIWRNKEIFRCGHLMCDRDYSRMRWTVDNQADFNFVSSIYQQLYPHNIRFGMVDILAHLALHPELAAINGDFIGKENYEKVWRPE